MPGRGTPVYNPDFANKGERLTAEQASSMLALIVIQIPLPFKGQLFHPPLTRCVAYCLRATALCQTNWMQIPAHLPALWLRADHLNCPHCSFLICKTRAISTIQQNFLWWWKEMSHVCAKTVATSHTWLLSVWNVASTCEGLFFNVCLFMHVCGCAGS